MFSERVYEEERVRRLMEVFGCSADAAKHYIDLIEEGVPVHRAADLAGLNKS